MSAPFHNDPELERLHLDHVRKLAAITAELGIPGDEPIEKILAYIRRLRRAENSQSEQSDSARK